MIVHINYENLHKYADAFRAQFRLRHECFIERQDYQAFKWRGMEYDQYDTPAANYLVYLSPEGEAWGCSRLTPVMHRSMLKDLWPQLVDDPAHVYRPDVWEGTRFCVKKNLRAELRLKIRRELALGYVESGLEAGIVKVIGVMPPLIFKRVFIDAGCHYQFLGEQMKIASGETIVAASIDVSVTALAHMQEISGIYDKVITEDGDNTYPANLAA
jgi:acyl homoserine lactone synthase